MLEKFGILKLVLMGNMHMRFMIVMAILHGFGGLFRPWHNMLNFLAIMLCSYAESLM